MLEIKRYVFYNKNIMNVKYHIKQKQEQKCIYVIF